MTSTKTAPSGALAGRRNAGTDAAPCEATGAASSEGKGADEVSPRRELDANGADTPSDRGNDLTNRPAPTRNPQQRDSR